MSFGQSGPPASTKQVQYLQSLLKKAGYDSFREARHPLGLTQRQSSGKFTKNEASTLIDQLVNGGSADGADGQLDGQMALTGEEISAADRLEAERIEIIRGMPAGLLAAELERRGWSCESPS